MNLLHLLNEMLCMERHGCPELLARNPARIEQTEKLARSVGGGGGHSADYDAGDAFVCKSVITGRKMKCRGTRGR